jgi:hypothetical protein
MCQTRCPVRSSRDAGVVSNEISRTSGDLSRVRTRVWREACAIVQSKGRKDIQKIRISWTPSGVKPAHVNDPIGVSRDRWHQSLTFTGVVDFNGRGKR